MDGSASSGAELATMASAGAAAFDVSSFDVADLTRRQQITDRLLASEGAGHLVHDLPLRADGRVVTLESRPWRLDPISLEIDGVVFDRLATSVGGRMQAFEAILDDLYNERRLVTEGVVPAPLLYASDRYRLSAVGRGSPRRWLTTLAVDCVELDDGSWRLVGDLTDAPSGLGYAILDRAVTARAFPEALGVDAHQGIAPIRGMVGVLHRALLEMAGVDSPRVVVYTGGHDHPSYVEHGYLATQLGFHMVEGADLVVRDRQVWVRTLDRLEPVDVVYRRLEDVGVDPLDVGAQGSAGVPGLLRAVASGGVVLANAHGSGVIEEPTLASRWSDAASVLGHDPLDLPILTTAEQQRMRLHPVMRDGAIATAPVIVRLQAIADGSRVTVMPGGTGRVLAPGDDPSLPTPCIAKDVWVRNSVTRPPRVVVSMPQVDLAGSVPTRAADALYWMNSAAERAEAIARTVRAVRGRLEQDPWIAADGFSVWTGRVVRLLQVVSVASGPPADHAVALDTTDGPAAVDVLRAELAAATNAVTSQLGTMLAEAVGVGEYLSATTGRVLERLARMRTRMATGTTDVDELSALIADLAAVGGLWHESTVRGPAWWLGDVGRRLERCLIVLGSVEAALWSDAVAVDEARDASAAGGDDTARASSAASASDAAAAGGGDRGGDENGSVSDITTSTVEVVLDANESLVAYRRRHRSNVEVRAATDLLLRDATNPRSFASSIRLVRDHVEALGWPDGVRLTERAIGALVEPEPMTLIPLARATVHELSAGVVERWFAAPVSPFLMRGTRPS